MRHNVTTPGGFFVGLGGIAAFCAVAAAVYCWVDKPTASNELEPQKTALGLLAKSNEADKQKGINSLLASAAKDYNGGKTPNLDNLDDLRGVVRYREADKSHKEAHALLAAKSTVEGKTVLEAAMSAVVTEIAAKKPAASAVKVDLITPAADAPVSMPNLQGGGAKTITFPTPVISAPPAPAAPAPSNVPAAQSDAVPAPDRPPLLKESAPTSKHSHAAPQIV